jgi:hypothetical protein
MAAVTKNRNVFNCPLLAGLSNTILKGTHPRTIPARFGLIRFREFRGEDLNVKVYDVRRTNGRTDGRRRTTDDGRLLFYISLIHFQYFVPLTLCLHLLNGHRELLLTRKLLNYGSWWLSSKLNSRHNDCVVQIG